MSGVGNVHGNFKRLSRRFWWVIRLGRHCCEDYNSAQTVAKPLISMVTFSWSYRSNYSWLHPWLWSLLTMLRSFFIECVLAWWFLSINNDFWENILEKKSLPQKQMTASFISLLSLLPNIPTLLLGTFKWETLESDRPEQEFWLPHLQS